MSQENISEYLNPSRFPRIAFGLKANSTLHRITLTPSNANPGETLYIEIPKLTDNMVIVPGSVFLVFNMAISGHENVENVEYCREQHQSKFSQKTKGCFRWRNSARYHEL